MTIPLSLEVKHLKMVRQIAGTGNLTRAAEQLFISQPALSQQLKDVETRLGKPLFIRTGKTMEPTPLGRQLLKRARTILNDIQQAEQEMAAAVNGETGELRIGVRCMFCYQWLPKIIARFRNQYPHVDVTIGNSPEADQDLLAEKTDIAISTSPMVHPKIGFVPLFEDEVRCVLPADHALAHKAFLEAEDFNGADYIAMVGKDGPSFYRFLLKDKGIRLKHYMTVAHPEAVVELVAAGLGIALLPRWFIAPYAETPAITTCSLTRRKTRLQWKASFLKHARPPAFFQAFISLMASGVRPF